MTPIELPYGSGSLTVDVDGLDVEPVRPAATPGAASDPDAVLAAALDRPLGAPRLEAMVSARESVLLVVSDATRMTAADRVVPAILERLERAGVSRSAVRLVVASGMHPPPDRDALAGVVGSEVLESVRLVSGGPWIDLGATRRGTPLRLHAALRDADRVILTGAIGFHYFAGFTGRKSILPGLASPAAIAANHLLALDSAGLGRHPRAVAGELDENPVHLDMAEACAQVDPAFLVNVIPGPGGSLEAAFAGHWDRAHREGCRELLRRRRVGFDGPRDLAVVSAGGHPHDLDLIQSHKAMEAARALVRPGGAMVVAAACSRGAGHPQLDRWLDGRNAAALGAALRGDYEVYGQTAHAIRSKAESVSIWLVSELPHGLVFRAGMRPAVDLPTALDEAQRHVGGSCRGYLLERGNAVLPVPRNPVAGSGFRRAPRREPPVDTPRGGLRMSRMGVL